MNTPLIDDFAYIRARLAELEGEPKEAEQPKAWPDYTPVDKIYDAGVRGGEIWGHYSAPDQDCAWRPMSWGHRPVTAQDVAAIGNDD